MKKFIKWIKSGWKIEDSDDYLYAPVVFFIWVFFTVFVASWIYAMVVDYSFAVRTAEMLPVPAYMMLTVLGYYYVWMCWYLLKCLRQ